MSQIVLSSKYRGERLDIALSKESGQSRSFWQRQIKAGLVTADNRTLKPHQLISDELTVDVRAGEKETSAIDFPPLPLDIIYEDEVIIVLNKPSGQIVHPGVGQTSESVAEALLRHYPEIIKARYTDSILSHDRAGIVHRLDKDTSGIMVVAKTYEALINLQSQFKDRTVSKEYRAVVYGNCADQVIDQPIGRHPKYRRKQAVVTNGQGREAVTRFAQLKTGTVSSFEITYLSCLPKTGRMHQIRVHLQSLNHCILGDPLYNTKKSRQASDALKVPRLALHAFQLTFRHPVNNREVSFEAPIPADLSTLISMI